MTKVVLVVLCGAFSVAGCGDEHHPPGGDGDDGDDGAGVEADAAMAIPDAAPGSTSAAVACERFADAYCRSTVVCERYTPPPGQDTVPGCVAVQEPYCLERRVEPVSPGELEACLTAIEEQTCGANMIIPGLCRVLWDTIVPDAGVPDAGVDPEIDAGVDAGTPDASL